MKEINVSTGEDITVYINYGWESDKFKLSTFK